MNEATSLAHTESGSGRRDIDALSELFGPEIVLPEQIVTGYRNDSYLSGEKALMLAVLEDSIRCFQEHLRNPRLNPRLLSEQAEDWIRAEDWDWPFSFNNVCDTLGIDPEALRSMPSVSDTPTRPVEQFLPLGLSLARRPAKRPTTRVDGEADVVV